MYCGVDQNSTVADMLNDAVILLLLGLSVLHRAAIIDKHVSYATVHGESPVTSAVCFDIKSLDMR